MKDNINQIPIKCQNWDDYILTTEEQIKIFILEKFSPYGAFRISFEYRDIKWNWDMKYTFGLF